MDLKIFPAGFNVEEFNKFCAQVITYKQLNTPDGAVYIFYKSPLNAGLTNSDKLDELDALIKRDEKTLLVHEIELLDCASIIADGKQKIASLNLSDEKTAEFISIVEESGSNKQVEYKAKKLNEDDFVVFNKFCSYKNDILKAENQMKMSKETMEKTARTINNAKQLILDIINKTPKA